MIRKLHVTNVATASTVSADAGLTAPLDAIGVGDSRSQFDTTYTPNLIDGFAMFATAGRTGIHHRTTDTVATPADMTFGGAGAAKATARIRSAHLIAANLSAHQEATPATSLTAKQRFIEAIATLRYSHGGETEHPHAWLSDRIHPALFASIAAPH